MFVFLNFLFQYYINFVRIVLFIILVKELKPSFLSSVEFENFFVLVFFLLIFFPFLFYLLFFKFNFISFLFLCTIVFFFYIILGLQTRNYHRIDNQFYTEILNIIFLHFVFNFLFFSGLFIFICFHQQLNRYRAGTRWCWKSCSCGQVTVSPTFS